MDYTYNDFYREVVEWEFSNSQELRISISGYTSSSKENILEWARSLGYSPFLESYNHNQTHFLILNKNQKYSISKDKEVPILTNSDPAIVTLDPELPESTDPINDNIDWDNCFVSISNVDDIPDFQTDMNNCKLLGIDLSNKEISDIAVQDYIEELKKLTNETIQKDSITYQVTQTLISAAYENFKKRNI